MIMMCFECRVAEAMELRHARPKHEQDKFMFFQALGKVMSIAITEISADCLVKGKGSACVLGKADITKTAEV